MEHGAQKVLIRTVDTFVVVIAIAEYSNLCLIRPDVSVCIAFGMGKHFQYKSIDTICEALGPRKAKALFTIPFHHLLRYHIVLPGKRKKSARDAWNAYEEVMEAFLSVLDSKFTPSDADFAVFSVIEQFVVVLYDKNSSTPQEESSSPRKGDHWKVFRQRSLRKHPFLLALRRWGRFARRNVCDSAAEIPY